MFLYCDRYATCNSVALAADTMEQSTMRLRAMGWHVWQGYSIGGVWTRVQLCDKCLQLKRVPPPERLDGEQPLFEVESQAPARDTR